MVSYKQIKKYFIAAITSLLTLSAILQIACLLPRSSGDRKVDSPIPVAKSYDSFESIPVDIDSNIGVSTLKFNTSGDLLIGTNFGLVQVENISDKISHLKWSNAGDVVEQIGIDESDGSVWFYNRFGGILVSKDQNNWQSVMKTEDFIKIRGDMFSRLEFVSVGKDFYMKTARSILKLNRATMNFESFPIPKIGYGCVSANIAENENLLTGESQCLTTIGKFNNKLALVLRSQPSADYIGNELSKIDFYDRIFVYENDKWSLLTDKNQKKIKIKKIVNDEEGSIVLLTDGSLVKIANDGTLLNLNAPERVVAIESSNHYGVLSVLQSGKIVSTRDNFRIIFDLEQEFPDRFHLPLIDTNESKIAVAWKDKKECLKVLTWNENNKIIWQKCD